MVVAFHRLFDFSQPEQFIPTDFHCKKGTSLQRGLNIGLCEKTRLSQLADRESWRHRHKYMYMILRDVSPQDLHIVSPTYLTDQISDPLCNLSSQNRLAVLRHPHKVILQVINGMAGLSIVLHTASIPKARVFLPIPEGDNNSVALRIISSRMSGFTCESPQAIHFLKEILTTSTQFYLVFGQLLAN